MARLIEVVGGSGPINEGERRVVSALVDQLPDNYWVAPNVEIADPGGQRFEYDVIVVAPHAVYVVETKDWRGNIRGDDREWLVDGNSRKAPLLATERKAKILKSKLVAHAPGLARVWVESAVVLASEPASLDLSAEAARRVFKLPGLIAFLKDPTVVRQRPAAIADLVGYVLKALSSHVRRRTGPLTFGSYEVIERLEQNENEAVYRARHRFMPGAPLVRLRVVTLSAYKLTDKQRADRRAALYRETEALLRMGSHPNVIASREVFEDEQGRIIVVLDGTDGRSLRQRLQDQTPMTIEERLDVLIDVCRALAHAHAHGVIHRRVEPESILIGDDGTARLGKFSLAKLLSNGAATVWLEDLASDVDQRYLAPELANPDLGRPGPATDLYELGCVAYELFAGHPPFESPSQSFAGMPASPNGIPDELSQLLSSLLAGDPSMRPVDAKDVLAVLEGLRAGRTSRPVTGPKDQYDPGDLIDGKFEVREKIGGGGFSTVYRVYWPLDDQEYALKVFNANVPYEKVQREVALLRTISNKHIVRAVWADQTRAGQWYLVSELVRGETLEAYAEGRKRLAVAEAVQVASDLLAALEAIHPDSNRIEELSTKKDTDPLTQQEFTEWQRLREHGIVHRDIKPQNLILTVDGVVLIDFNISSRIGQAVDTLSGTPRYQSPDILPGLENWDVSTDLFAVGVVLYELLCHSHPYPDGLPRLDRLPKDPREFRRDLAPGLCKLLMKACAPRRKDRFLTANEMRLALESIDPLVVQIPSGAAAELSLRLQQLLADAPRNVNPMVREFLGLASQARRSNRRTRGMDDVAAATYVETRLDSDLSSSVLSGKHRLVLVTGNAGDGKTAFIQQVEAAAKRAGATAANTSSNGSQLRYAGHEIRTLYDGSQDEVDRTSDEVLLAFLGPFADGSKPDGGTRIAAINEGRLRDFLLVHRSSFGSLSRHVVASLDSPGDGSTGSDIVVVNLNARSLTAGKDQSIFTRQLRKIVSGPFWDLCEACDYRARCPLKHNVDTFRDSTSGPAVTERLRMLINLIRLRRRRHLTMRDARSLISYLLFRDRTCEEVPTMLGSDSPLDVIDLAYFQTPGAVGAPEGSAIDRGAELLAEIDIGIVANPEDDRILARESGPRRMSFPSRTSDYPAELIREVRKRAGTGYEGNVRLARRAHEAGRRQAYFERADDGWWEMLPYERLKEFEAALNPDSEQLRRRLRGEIIKAVSVYEGMTDMGQAGKALWLATNEGTSPDYACFRRFPVEEFILRIAKSGAPYIESEPDRLELVHSRSGSVLNLDVDLLELMEHLSEGYLPSLDEGRGLLVNLRLFKNRLLAEPASELMFISGQDLLRIAKGADKGSVELRAEVT